MTRLQPVTRTPGPFGLEPWMPATWSSWLTRALPPAFLEEWEETAGRWTPRVDVKETPEAYEVSAEVPGMKPEEVDVSMTGDTLTIKGEKRQEEKRKEESHYITERTYGSFQRTITFPAPVKADKVEAETHDGLLFVRVPKSEKSGARKISVRRG